MFKHSKMFQTFLKMNKTQKKKYYYYHKHTINIKKFNK